jgi:hypothetical protein
MHKFQAYDNIAKGHGLMEFMVSNIKFVDIVQMMINGC